MIRAATFGCVLAFATAMSAGAEEAPADEGAAASTAAADPIAAQTAQETLRKLQLENEAKALANTQTKLTIDDARRKTITDAVPASTTTGATDVKDGAGKMEAQALAARALNAVAPQIAAEARAAARAGGSAASRPPSASPCTALPTLAAATPQGTPGPAPMLLVGGGQKLGFARWEQFRFRACKLAVEFTTANTKAQEALSAQLESSTLGGSGAAGAAVTVASKLLQLVTPDWQLGPIAFDTTERAAMSAVARSYLRNDCAAGPGQGAQPPCPPARLYWTDQVSKLGGGEAVFSALLAIDTLDQKAGALADEVGAKIAEQQKIIKDEAATKPQKEAAAKELAKWTAHAAALKTSRDAYALLLKHLDGSDPGAALPINSVIEEAALEQLLGPNGLVLALHVEASGGGYYTRKVIWNALFGGMPFFVSGGVVVDFAVVRPSDQQVMAAGLFACSAGYVKLNQVQGVSNGDSPVVCKPTN